jgi:branched-chain amino acid transport system permease protein
MTLLLTLLVYGLVNGAVIAVLSCGFGLVYRCLRVFHVAFAGLFLVAPYTAFMLNRGLGLPAWLAAAFGVPVAALAGYLVEHLVYRPMQRGGASSGALMVASLGAATVLENCAALAFGNETRALGRIPAAPVVVGPIRLAGVQVLQLVTAVAVVVGFVVASRRVRLFRAIWAMGDEPGLMLALGWPLWRMRDLVALLSGVLVGLGSALIGLDVGIDPHVGLSFLLAAAVAVLAGGLGRIGGWVLGAFALALLQNAVVWWLSARWRDLATFAVLIGILLLRPRGVLEPGRRIEEG